MIRFRSLVLVAGLLGLLVGPSHAEDAPAKVLRVVPSADLTQLDPTFASIVITRIYGLMVYETLFAWDSKMQPKPQMVKEWSTAPDGLTWRFTLRSRTCLLKLSRGNRAAPSSSIG